MARIPKKGKENDNLLGLTAKEYLYIVLAIIVSSLITVTAEAGESWITVLMLGLTLRMAATFIIIWIIVRLKG